jgi:ribosomal protein L7/L12
MAKLDKIKFARLIGFLERVHALNLKQDDVELIDEIIDIPDPEPQIVPGKADHHELDRLLFLMAQGHQKIEAIKQYRTLTGQGLKEAKDAVERHWDSNPILEKND